ncbi:ABC transporter C-terminal domain-containing protein [Coprobacillaceae bacterium CR2/5/TPMF4]|nr:ABC transporter C-terminal domain-containing protein [Coprobacillaceae bacterium CR2/5/TPMF4]
MNDLTNELHSDEVVNDYQKYNQISDQITDLENQLNDLLEQWKPFNKGFLYFFNFYNTIILS